jgi:ribosomal protein S6--L-glutamate ligase
LEVAGVDLLEGKDGPKVMEVNASPGFEGLERVTGVDIAGAILRHAERIARPTTQEADRFTG